MINTEQETLEINKPKTLTPYVNADGVFLGHYCEQTAPEEATQTETAPQNTTSIWNAETESWVEQETPTSYQKKRREAYPSIGDQLDALWKGGSALEQMEANIMAIKALYPKPE